MHNSLGFYIGNFFVAYYGLIIFLGIVIALSISFFRLKKHKLNIDNYIIFIAVSGLFAIIFAKALYLILEYKNINFSKLSDPFYLSHIMSSGFVFYGGLIGFLFGLYFVHKIIKINLKGYIQLTIFAIPLVHGFGRIGCYNVGCCYGKKFTSSISIMYTNSIIAPNNVYLFPVQLVESLCNFIIAFILLAFSKKLKNYNGLYLYLILYGICRFILEFFRGDLIRGVFYNISSSQYISILLVLTATILLIKSNKKHRSKKSWKVWLLIILSYI